MTLIRNFLNFRFILILKKCRKNATKNSILNFYCILKQIHNLECSTNLSITNLINCLHKSQY